MQHVSVTRQLAIPVDRAYAYLSELENIGEAAPGLKVKRLNDGTDGTRNGVGARRSLSIGGLLPFEETVTEAVPNELIRYRITKGSPLRDHKGEVRFAASGTGTTVTWNIDFDSKVPGLGAPLAKGLTQVVGRAFANAEQHG